MYKGTYSPEDNKLRLYSMERLDSELYERVKAAGFKYAPAQKLFVAPMWTPSREDLLLELCGEIEDEDTSLVERAEERADRFETYSDNRAEDAERAKKAVESIADNIPFGQPILVGHHSERHARRDAQKIENGMRKAVQMWETSKYWEDRAKGAIHHAKYKERPDVRARRIKGLEADLRKQEKETKQAELFLKLWRSIQDDSMLKSKEGEGTPRGRALYIAKRDFISKCFTLAEYPRELPKSQYEGSQSVWSALDDEIITAEQAQEIAIRIHERGNKHRARWINHLKNRLTYEKAMLEESGASNLLDKKPRPKQLPLCNYRAPETKVENTYHQGEFSTYQQKEMTKAEYSALYESHRGTATIDYSHRVRTYFSMASGNYQRFTVFLTDQKETLPPEPQSRPKTRLDILREQRDAAREEGFKNHQEEPEKTEFDAMKETLKAGIKTVSAPQLFPTPPEIAQKMIEYADIQPGHDVLEPSAGTGNLLKALPCVRPSGSVTAVEKIYSLKEYLEPYADNIFIEDFFNCNGNLGKFDRIVMNPPFENGIDIKHINHALTFLKDGGKLVALCANGSRQRAAFMDIADHWEDLPAGSFKSEGTGVNVALMVISK